MTDALSLRVDGVKARLPKGSISNGGLSTPGGPQSMLLVDEFGIYVAVFQSRKKEAQDFRFWVYSMLKMLRQQSGLEGFEVFRMLDKEHQREAMARLQDGISPRRQSARADFIKCNTIANKAVSSWHGYPKMIGKSEMTPEMLTERQEVLDDTVSLMALNERYSMGLSVSERIYKGRKQGIS